MRKIFILAKREYRTAVRTKSFIIGLVIAPVFFGGGLIAYFLLKDKVDTKDKIIAVLDRSGVIASALEEAANERNETYIFDSITEKKIKPAYIIKTVQPDLTDPNRQKLDLSRQVRDKNIHAFLEIGHDIIHPGDDPERSRIKYYSENSFVDDIKNWISWPVNNRIRQLRAVELNIDPQAVDDLLYWINIDGMGLISMDNKTGGLKDARESNPLESILIPYILMFLMFMMVMMAAVPLLSAVMEEKMERIAEVLLGSVTPFQFMMGKVLGGISVSLTGSSIYIIGGIITATQLGYEDVIPYNIIPWFLVYMVLNILMVGSVMAALGSACNDSKDAQSLQFPAMLPLILPMFFLLPVIKEPLGVLATSLSLIPPFTPLLMLVRQASPVSIPTWQPIAGLIGIVIFTVISVWAGGKIFRTGILMQGKKPKLSTLIKWAIKG